MCDFTLRRHQLRLNTPENRREIVESFNFYFSRITAGHIRCTDCVISFFEASESSYVQFKEASYSFKHIGQISFQFDHIAHACELPLFFDTQNSRLKLLMPDYYELFFPDLGFYLQQALDSFDAGTGFFRQETRPDRPMFKELFTDAHVVLFDRCPIAPEDIARLEGCKPYIATKETPEPGVTVETFRMLRSYIVDALSWYIHPKYDIDASEYLDRPEAYRELNNEFNRKKEDDVARCTAQFLADYTNKEGLWKNVSPHQRKLLENQILNLAGLETAELRVKLVNVGYIIYLMHRDNDIGYERLSGCAKTLWTRLLCFIGDYEKGRVIRKNGIEKTAFIKFTLTKRATDEGRFEHQYQIPLRRARDLVYSRNRAMGVDMVLEPGSKLEHEEEIFELEEDLLESTQVAPVVRPQLTQFGQFSVFGRLPVQGAAVSQAVHNGDEESFLQRQSSQVSIYASSPPDGGHSRSPIKQMMHQCQSHDKPSALLNATTREESDEEGTAHVLGGITF